MIDLRDIVPGGLRPTDHVHVTIHDDTCSRCRCPIADDEVPLMLWIGDGDRLVIFCRACCDGANDG